MNNENNYAISIDGLKKTLQEFLKVLLMLQQLLLVMKIILALELILM